jgi:hypothetical protein
MNFKKILFLFLALLLPVLIFIFLKSFGKNEFIVAPLFHDAVEAPHEECSSFAYTAPYQIPDSVLAKLTWGINDSLTLVVFEGDLQKRKENGIQIERFLNEFRAAHVNVLSKSKKTTGERGTQEISSTYIDVNDSQFSIYRNCIFLFKQSDNAAVVDKKGKIRGQYDLSDREEADRLIIETKILLKEY